MLPRAWGVGSLIGGAHELRKDQAELTSGGGSKNAWLDRRLAGGEVRRRQWWQWCSSELNGGEELSSVLLWPGKGAGGQGGAGGGAGWPGACCGGRAAHVVPGRVRRRAGDRGSSAG